jgi:nucleotide-binding universal stress UspA family protein
MHHPPQPSTERLPEFSGHPVLIGITEQPSPLVVEAGLRLAAALNSPSLHLAWADPGRDVVSEDPDGTVHHVGLDADSDDRWEEREESIRTQLSDLLAEAPIPWSFHYLAGRPDRALTHLARAVDAGIIVVGTRGPGLAERLRETLSGPVATHLALHQHRPVLAVPLTVVDWKERIS